MGQEVRTGMTDWELLRPYLPGEWITALQQAPRAEQDSIQEVRLRAGQPVTVSVPTGDRYLCPGGLTALRQPGVFRCGADRLERCFMAFCEGSVYAHEWELRQGYLAVPGGIRVGVAGTAVTDGGAVRSVQNVTALCVRLPRHVAGCAAHLQGLVLSAGYPSSTLLVGPPSSGKTTLLRDLAAGLAARHRVAVVDERGELAGVCGLPGCDVLRGYPKAVGIRQAVRCLAPEVVIFDELGDEAEARAVAACAHAGVAVVASLHGHSPWELAQQPLPRMLIQQRVFARWLFLVGRQSPGRWQGCYAPEEHGDGIYWTPVDFDGRDGSWRVRRPAPASTHAVFAADRWDTTGPVAADDLYSPAYDRVVAAVGTE